MQDHLGIHCSGILRDSQMLTYWWQRNDYNKVCQSVTVSCFEILNNMEHNLVHTHMIEFLKNTIKDSWDLLVSYHVLEKDTALNMSCSLVSCFPCKGKCLPGIMGKLKSLLWMHPIHSFHFPSTLAP